MAFADIYRKQVALLMRVLPSVAEEECFALKGGTAINLFVRDMPRLSVDIDLTYLPVAPRAESLSAINAAMRRIAAKLKNVLSKAHINEVPTEGAITRLVVRSEGIQTKIEVTPVLRGCVFTPEKRAVSPKVESAFGFAEIAVVSFADLYAGKTFRHCRPARRSSVWQKEIMPRQPRVPSMGTRGAAVSSKV